MMKAGLVGSQAVYPRASYVSRIPPEHIGRGDIWLSSLGEATEIEEGLPFEFGPPASLKPPHELLGEVAMAAGEHAVAFDAFREALDFTPERTPSLAGLAESAQALGRTAMSADAQARLTEIRGGN